MNTTLEQLKGTVDSLSASERAALAQYLLRSLEPEEPSAQSEWAALAEQRMADVRAGRVCGIPADEVLRSQPELPR